jgi:tetratricopeptide (TPR) repeat protein
LPTLLFGVVVGLWAGTFGSPAGSLVLATAPGAGRRSVEATRPAADRANADLPDALPGALPPPTAQPSAPRSPETERIFAESRMHFDAGQNYYAHQRYEDAIRSFQAGYALVPRPNFLVNIGQSYRKLGNLVRAKEAYVAYVRALPENSALRDQALQVLAEIEVQLQDGQAGAGATNTASPTGVPAGQPARLDQDVSGHRHSPVATWLGVGIGGAGLGLIAAGIAFQLRAKSVSDALGMASERGEAFDAAEERAGQRAERYGNGLFIAGGAAMAAGALLFLIIDGSSDRQASIEPHRPTLALSADQIGVAWRF